MQRMADFNESLHEVSLMTVPRMIRALVDAALWECCPAEVVGAAEGAPWLERTLRLCGEDAAAFANKDPAARGKPETVIASYTSFKAVLHYRLAHALLSAGTLPGGTADSEPYAMLVSSRGKLLSGAELHPRCRIGRRFVLDHGVGTVFGETTELGDDCYVLGGVTLGAAGIAGNPAGKRHPTVGHRVQIGAFARVFGAVSIGDDVFIGPHSVITQDVPPSCSVTVRTSHQVIRVRCTQATPQSGCSIAVDSQKISKMVAEQ